MVAVGEEAVAGALTPAVALDKGVTVTGPSVMVWSSGVGGLDDEG